MLLAGVTHILHVLVVLLVVVVDVVLQLQENGQGHARALLFYLTIQFEGIYQFSNFNPRFNERTSELGKTLLSEIMKPRSERQINFTYYEKLLTHSLVVVASAVRPLSRQR